MAFKALKMNNLDFEPTERAIRESTPSNLIRDEDNISSPIFSTKYPRLTAENQRPQSSILTNIPSTVRWMIFFHILSSNSSASLWRSITLTSLTICPSRDVMSGCRSIHKPVEESSQISPPLHFSYTNVARSLNQAGILIHHPHLLC